MTPSDFMIHFMDDIDDVAIVLIIQRNHNGNIIFNTNTGSRYDAYALASITKAFTEADIVKSELKA